jgi:hypothetical protein
VRREYTITALAADRRRLCATQAFMASKASYVAMRCDNCGLPFAFHAVSYAADVPFADDEILVPGAVVDLECLPPDRRDLFTRQFLDALTAWRSGNNEAIIALTMPIRAASPPAPPPPDEQGLTFKYRGEVNLEAIRARLKQRAAQAVDQTPPGIVVLRDEAVGPYDDEFYNAPLQPARGVTKISTKRRLFDDGQ